MADKVTRAIKAEPEKQTVNGAAKAAPRFIDEQARKIRVAADSSSRSSGTATNIVEVELHRLKGKDFSKFRTLVAVGVSEDEATLSLIYRPAGRGHPGARRRRLSRPDREIPGFYSSPLPAGGGERASFRDWPEFAGVIAHVLHFPLAELREMDFSELVEVWFPVASEITRTSGTQLTRNMIRGTRRWQVEKHG